MKKLILVLGLMVSLSAFAVYDECYSDFDCDFGQVCCLISMMERACMDRFLCDELAPMSNSDTTGETETPECEVDCRHLGYSYLPGYLPGRPMCYEISECKYYKWDEKKMECVLDKTEEQKWPIPCHNIPPM